MQYRLLLVDGQGEAVTSELRLRMLREFPGPGGLSVHFRPVRNDVLFESAREAGRLAYRILAGEGKVRAELWVEYEVPGAPINVMGRSSDLLFALALITSTWNPAAGQRFTAVAATGVLGSDGSVQSVDHTAGKVAAAVRELNRSDCGPAVIFYPAADSGPALDAAVAAQLGTVALPGHIELRPVAHLDDALAHLGFTLDQVYLRNPFRGLEHFEYSDHAIFFGRDAETRAAIEQLLRRESAGAPGLLIEGASGSGKSSFLRAGVLPALVEPRFQAGDVQQALARRPVSAEVADAVWRPGLLPPHANERSIARSIAKDWARLSPLTGIAGDPETLAALADARREHWPGNRRFVWMIDQFEEILTLGLSDELLETFGQFLCRLQADGVWTLASIRADALSQFKRHDALRAVFGNNEGQCYLATLRGTALDEVIDRPARAADLEFERGPDGIGLDQRLRDDAYREQDALPLLQFTLNELYLRRSGRMLTLGAYQELGGLSGSIATAAAAVLADDGSADGGPARTARRLFRSLVSVDESGHATRRYAPLADITADPAQQLLLTRLIAARLCVTDQRAGEPVVAFAHDTLLHTLPALTDWLQHEAGLLQTRELAQRDTRQWQVHGESDDWLAADDKLNSFQELEAADVVLPEAVRSFIAGSARRARRQRRRRRLVAGVIGVLGAGVIAGALAFGLQARKAEEAREMTARRGEFLEGLLKSADPRGGKRDVTVAQLLDASAPQVEKLAVTEPLVAASMFGLIAETDQGLGRFAEGLSSIGRALELQRSHGGRPADLSAALSVKGALLMSAGRNAEAEAPLKEAAALVEHERGAEKQLAEALDSLGAVYQETSRETEAELAYERSLAAYRRGGAALAVSAAAADPLCNLGVLRFNEGRNADAVHFMESCVNSRRKSLTPDHPDLLDAEYNYASALQKDNQVVASEPLFRELLASYTRVLGSDHIDTLMAQEGVARNLNLQRRYAEAAVLALPAAEGMSKAAGDDHEWTQTAWETYGVAACHAGQGDAGLAALHRSARHRRAHDDGSVNEGADARRTATTDIKLGACLVSLHRYAEAEPLLLNAVAVLEALRGKTYDHTQEGYQALRDLYAGLGRTADSGTWSAKLLTAER